MAARQRLHPRLPRIPGDPSSEIETGFVDKVTLKLSGAQILVHRDSDLRSYLEIISNSDTGLFRRGQGRAQNTLEIRHGWHVRGSVRFTKAWLSHGGQRFRYKAELHLNPSRFLAHNPHAAGRGYGVTADDLRLNSTEEIALRENSLDGQDNYLAEPLYRAMIGSRDFGRIFYGYLYALRELIESELNLPLLDAPSWFEVQSDLQGRGSDWNIVRINEFDECIVDHSEIYWERWCLDALGKVRDIERQIGPTVRRLSRRMFEVSDLVQPGIRPRSRDQNSLSFSVDTGRRGIELLTYAKCWQRVRLELKYKKSLRRHLNDKPPSEGQGDWDVYASDMVDAAVADAHRRIRPFFEELHRRDDGQRFGVEHLLDVFRRIIDACDGDQPLASEVMTIITQTDGILHPYEGRPRGDEPSERDRRVRAAITQLVRQKILEPSKTQSRGARARRFSLAPAIRKNLQRMRE